MPLFVDCYWKLIKCRCIGWSIHVAVICNEGDLSALRVESCSDDTVIFGDTGTHPIKGFAAHFLTIKATPSVCLCAVHSHVQSKPPALLWLVLFSHIHSFIHLLLQILGTVMSFCFPLLLLYLSCTLYRHSRSQSLL